MNDTINFNGNKRSNFNRFFDDIHELERLEDSEIDNVIVEKTAGRYSLDWSCDGFNDYNDDYIDTFVKESNRGILHELQRIA